MVNVLLVYLLGFISSVKQRCEDAGVAAYLTEGATRE